MQMNNADEAKQALKEEGRSTYLLWLIWVVWTPLTIPIFLVFFQTRPSLPRLILTLLGVALFLAIYLWGSLLQARQFTDMAALPKRIKPLTWLTIAALTVFSLAFTLFAGNEWIGMFYFTSGFVGGCLPARKAVVTAIVITIPALAVGWLAGLGWLTLVQVVVFIPAIVFITRSVMWSLTTSWELHAARKEIARLAVMTERLRIARDLHDLLGHNLSLIALKSELAGRLLNVAPERAAVEVGDIEQVARTTLQEVREAVASYRQPTLASELHAAQEILGAAGIAYRLQGDERMMGELPPGIEGALSWAVREGVTNVIRHSRAQHCTMRVTRANHEVSLEILDDGIGAEQAKQHAPTGGLSAGNGLRGLTERVMAIGGRCETGTRGSGGFRVAVAVPLEQRKQDAHSAGEIG